MDEEYRMVIPGILSKVPEVCDFVVSVARKVGLDDRAAYHCQMAVDEACTNIIEHGYGRNNPGGWIEIICCDKPDRYVIRIIDDSPPFNPLLHAEPDPNAALSERGRGGWGIYFIKKMMDEATYTYENNRNHLTIAKLKTPKNLAAARTAGLETGTPVRPLDKGYWEVIPNGRLESNTAPGLQTVLNGQIESGRVRLVVNMSDVTYISTSGLKVLVNTWRRARERGGDVKLAGLTPHVLEVFETVGFDQLFGIYHTVDDALQSITDEAA